MSKREIERRYFAQPVEFRAGTDGGMGKLGGYAAVFNRTSQNLGGFVEQVDPTAFNKTLGDGARVLCRTHHSDEWLLGTTEAETLRVSVDGTGLLYECDLPDTSAGRDTQALAQRTDMRYSSFAFRCIEDEWDITPDGFPIRTLLQVQLVDVAPVVNPAYMDSSVGMRSLAERLDVDPATIGGIDVEEIRSLLVGDVSPAPIVEDGPRETHPLVTIRAMRLALDAKR
jgi:Escherichia/Staphylococcus phage prohead protease